MENLEAKFAEILKELRKKRNLSQEELAIDSELDRTYISLLERGLRQPTLRTLFKLAQVLEVSPSWIVKQLEQRE